MDKETIIKDCENWVNNHKNENLLLTYSSVVELLALLKEKEAVVLCKDCKNAAPAFDGKMARCKFRGLRKNDYFCADGER